MKREKNKGSVVFSLIRACAVTIHGTISLLPFLLNLSLHTQLISCIAAFNLPRNWLSNGKFFKPRKYFYLIANHMTLYFFYKYMYIIAAEFLLNRNKIMCQTQS